MGDRDTLPPALRAACALSSFYAAPSAMTCVSPALNAGLSAMRCAALRSTSVDAGWERGERERSTCGERGAGGWMTSLSLGRDCA
jgi:hypothetical protein